MKPAILFENIRVLTPKGNDDWHVRERSFVAVEDGKVVAVEGDQASAASAFQGQGYETYDGKGKLMLPALSNLHGHIPMTLFRNQADDRNLQDWLFNVIFPREEKLTAHSVACGTRLGLCEMIRSGTGAAADMYYHHETVAETAVEAGFRLMFSCDSKEEGPDGRETVDPGRMQAAMDMARQAPDDLLRASLLVHSVYLYEERLYRPMAELARELDCPVQVHVAETRQEVVDCLEQYGRRPARQLQEFGFFATPTLAAHCVHLDDDERLALQRDTVTCVHNPASNLKLGSGFADLRAMQARGLSIGLGTDGAASNNNLDLYRDMRLAAFLQKGLHGDASIMPARTLLTMATLGGMKGLGFEQSGKVEPGMAADLQIVDLEQSEMTPLGDPVSALVYSASGAFVESLMVAGRFLMKKRELLTIDEEKARHEAKREADRLNA